MIPLLPPKGYLFVGVSESLFDCGPEFKAQAHCKGTFYQPNLQRQPAMQNVTSPQLPFAQNQSPFPTAGRRWIFVSLRCCKLLSSWSWLRFCSESCLRQKQILAVMHCGGPHKRHIIKRSVNLRRNCIVSTRYRLLLSPRKRLSRMPMGGLVRSNHRVGIGNLVINKTIRNGRCGRRSGERSYGARILGSETRQEFRSLRNSRKSWRLSLRVKNQLPQWSIWTDH